jgi:hypothetical protein
VLCCPRHSATCKKRERALCARSLHLLTCGHMLAMILLRPLRGQSACCCQKSLRGDRWQRMKNKDQ